MGHALRAFTVHGYVQAVAVLAGVGPTDGRAITLLSSPATAVYSGVGWWRAMIQAARNAHPNRPCIDILDCLDAPGAAMAALRRGQSALVLDPACPAFAAVSSAAASCGATVLATRPLSLDLAQADAFTRLRDWLDADDSDIGLR